MEFLEPLRGQVTTKMNVELSSSFAKEKVIRALKQMHPTKNQGPDGMPPPLFYQKHWGTIGEAIMTAVLIVLNTGQFPLDSIILSLRLYLKRVQCLVWRFLGQLNFCNIIYNLISKVITNRLKLILPHIISESQSAFVPGRQITDNILIAY